ncbi:MAG TPA: hypothetical protein VFE98_08950 [Candidatus Bathyarchaeia archaeon]|nr:hypothetical protein [Candidatus Bathyarchaeia archaeon]
MEVRPVKLRDSLYLLIPVDIVRLLEVGASSNFHLALSENDECVKLVYEMKKKGSRTTVDESSEPI